MRKIPLLAILTIFACLTLNAQSVSDLFQTRGGLSRDYRNAASKYQSLQINKDRLSALRFRSDSKLKLELPFENRQLKLDLTQVQLTTDNFSVIEALPGGGRREVDYSGAIFYQGKIEGVPSSFATITLVDGQVYGVIADDKSNIVLGAIEENGRGTDEYVLYRETDLQGDNPFTCFTDEIPADGVTSTTSPSGMRPTAVGEPVEIYFECDLKFYQDKGSVTNNVINYVLSFFNNTALLYANEDIKVQVSQILVWTTQDPEAAAGINNTSAALTSFRNRMAVTDYIGDYAHFLSTRNLGGGIAYLLGSPCTSGKQFRSAVSAINNTFLGVPTYSWTVQVVTHELGHNLGSNHTQWCGWTGGAIDNCFTTEGGCPPGPTPVNGGTIMSYCHLSSIGINFNNGFGTQPGDKIRSVVGAAMCFSTCRMTIEVSKMDASCNQANGSASVTATNHTGALTYLWSNGQTGATLSNVLPGTYHVTVSDASGCQVMQVVTVGNSGSALSVSLTPSGSAGLCVGGNLLLSTPNNPSYTYVWRKDNIIIPGASTSSYNVTTAGTYAVTVTSGACSGSQSVVVAVVAAPTASVTAGGSTSFCDGGSVLLNGNAGGSYLYQWYNNGVPVSGATSPTYSATVTGNYTVKVSAGAACEATSAPVSVNVSPSPVSGVVAVGTTSFCDGNSVVLNSATGAGQTYQWYRNGILIPGATQPAYTATLSGNYTALTAIGSCTRTSNPVSVTALPNPVVQLTPASSTIQKFSTQELLAAGAESYNWLVQPALISSSNNSGVFRPLTTTQYTIEGTSANGCKGIATATINVIGCGPVTNITATSYSPSRTILRWTNPEGATGDSIRYRIVGTAAWTTIYVTGEEHELNGLTPGANYEYQIIPLCTTTTVYTASAMQVFTTPALDGGLYIRLYPNPVVSTSQIEIITAEAYSLQISIYDNAGKLVKIISPMETRPAGQVMKPIYAGALSNGVYYIAVTVNGRLHTVKMLVGR